ncbi:hypothetical protein GC209_12290 [bacterium]|nr:hypothetical protein [bacterium]
MTTPRRSALSLTLTGTGWFHALFLTIGLAVAAPAEVMFERAWRLQMGGAEVSGQVLRLWQGTQSCGRSNLDICTTWNVAYGFDAGGWRTTQTSVSQDLYDTLREGGPIAVRYVLADPTINEVDFGWTFFGGMLLFLFALAFGVTGFWGLRVRARRAAQMVLLRDTGTPRRAEVTGLEATRTRVNGRALCHLVWRDETGAMGKSAPRRSDRLPPPGAEITVYADPAGRLPAVWKGDCGSR